jgi:vacuolar-type H+-ATPase subunit H
MSGSEITDSVLEVIRRKEAEIKRRLAVQREAGEMLLAETEERAHELLIAAEAEGRSAGEAQRQAAQAAAEAEAQAIVARAQAEAQRLQQVGQPSLVAAVARAVELVIGGAHEA